MATTLTSDQDEMVHFSFPIEKREDTATINPVDGTPDILITGKATDGTIDGDREIVDPEWSAKAIQEWCDTGGNVRMSHDPKRPVGKGQHVQVTTDGHYVTSLIADPLCKHFIRTGVLNDYSVGISMPDFRHRDSRLDPQGKALRIITGRPDGLSRIAELSVVDRGSNFNSRFQIVRKSAGNGDGDEFVGKMVGDEDEITKAAPAGLLTKDASGVAEKSVAPAEPASIDTWTGSADLDISFTPNDMMRLMQSKFVEKHYDDLAAKAAIDAEKAPAVAADEAKETVEKTDAPEAQDVEVPEAVKEAEPEVTKDPEPEPEPAAKKAKKPKAKKKLPPWLNKPKDGDGDSDDDDASKACKSAADHLWAGVEGTSDIECSKCHTTPAAAAGVTASAMNPAPVGELMETPAPVSVKGATPASASGAAGESMKPVPAHREPDGALTDTFEADSGLSDGDHETPTRLEATMKGTSPEVAALLRFQHAGIDPEAGRLHDLTCPAYHPADVAKHHPFADFTTAIDLDGFQRKAMTAAAGGDLSRAKAMQQVLYAASALKTADAGWLNDCRLAAYKAFRDANPGPSSFPTPGAVSPRVFCRPLVTDGHEASSAGHSGPTTSPQVATSPPDAHGFGRPPLSAGHQSPSPSHMKANFEYPDGTGRPVHLNYASMEKDRARQALMQVHEHLSRQFPEACPISLDGPQQPERKPVPPIAGIGKSDGGVIPGAGNGSDEVPLMLDNSYVVPAAAAAALKAEPEQDGLFMDAEVCKGFKKMRKKLGKKVLSGSMTVDEARAKLGRQFAQKGADEPQEAVQKSAATPQLLNTANFGMPAVPAGDPRVADVPASFRPEAAPPAAASFGPADIEAAVTKAVAPLLEKIREQDETYTTRLAEQQRVIDAIADQPDPSTAAFSGLAFKPVHKTARPAAVPDIAESAARAQDMIRRNLQSTYYTHSSPAVREAAGQELAKLGWEPSMT